MGTARPKRTSNNPRPMKHNNQVHSTRKFRKYWQRYVKTWFNQPARKKARRTARDKKAALVAPRPVAGCVRPIVHPPTVKYNSKTRMGRGFSLAEIKAVGLGKLEAQSLGIAVDPRRRNASVEGQQANVQRLKEYKANLVLFPRNAKQAKKGWANDSSPEECAVASQVTSQVVMKPAAASVPLRPERSPRGRARPTSPAPLRQHGITLASLATVQSATRRGLIRRLRML